MTVRVEGTRQLEARLRAVQDVPKKMLGRIGLRAVREQKLLVARKTSHTARTIRLGSVTSSSVTTTVQGAGPYLEFGTRPHIIRPRKAKMLRFPAPGTGVTLGGRVRTGELRRLGKGAYVFAGAVKHPGTKPQPFMVPGMAKARDDEGVKAIISAWNGAA